MKSREEGQWFSVFRNQEFPINHGYYITRQPSTEERQDGIEWEQARTQETAFFKDPKCCWIKEDNSRLGVEKLVQALSRRLSIMIAKTY